MFSLLCIPPPTQFLQKIFPQYRQCDRFIITNSFVHPGSAQMDRWWSDSQWMRVGSQIELPIKALYGLITAAIIPFIFAIPSGEPDGPDTVSAFNGFQASSRTFGAWTGCSRLLHNSGWHDCNLLARQNSATFFHGGLTNRSKSLFALIVYVNVT